jgi:hypothetical protein
MTKSTNHTGPGFAGFFKSSDSESSYCSIEAALKLGLVQPDEDPEFVYTHKQGKLPYAAAISMGLIDKEAAAVIKGHPNVHRVNRGVIEYTTPAAPRGPLADYYGSPVGEVALALQKYVASRSEEDLAVFAQELGRCINGAFDGWEAAPKEI